MSRAISALLVLSSLSSSAFARRLPSAPAPVAPPVDTSAGFAKPPGGGQPSSSELQVAPPNIGDPIVAPTRAQVRAALARARAKNLAFFRAYYKAGIYPSNTYVDKTLNVWRDEAGHFCAAATIMVKSGNKDLAIRVADDNNFIKLGDVRHGEVMDWITMSGFTQAELALIQRPFRPVTELPQLPSLENGAPKVVINTSMRKQETARLLALYKLIDAKLVASQKKSIDAATNVLLKNPQLAWDLVNSESL